MPDDVLFSAKPHPVKSDTESRTFAFEGRTILEMIEKAEINIDYASSFRCWIDGTEIDKKYWEVLKPKGGTNVVVAAVPGSSDSGKNALRVVATIAVMAAAGGLGAPLAASLGWGFKGAAAVATGVIGVAGQLAVNALIPPPKPERQNVDVGRSGPGPQITGDSNQANPYGAIPRVLGKFRMHPMLAAKTFTETQGSEQYYRMLLTCGYGPVKIDDIRIGQTPINNYDDVEVEIREGRPTDEPTHLYSNQVSESTENVTLDDNWMQQVTEGKLGGTEMLDLNQFAEAVFKVEKRRSRRGHWETIPDSEYAIGLDGNLYRSDGKIWDEFILDEGTEDEKQYNGWRVTYVYQKAENNGYVQRTTELETDEVIFDITFPNGLARFRDSGGRVTEEVWLQAEWSPAGENEWTTIDTRRVTNDEASRFAVGFREVFNQRGQYDIRVRRLTPDRDNDQIQETAVLTAVRSVKDEDPVDFSKNLSLIALRIRASEQLQGQLQRVNVLAQSYGTDYNPETETWIENQLIDNPAAIYRLVAQDDANPRDLEDERLDLGALEDWYVNCKNDGFTYSSVIDYRDTVHELLQEIAAVGKASFTMKDGLFSIVQDRPQAVPRQHFTPRNSWNFSADKAFADHPDAWRIKFMNEEQNYIEDERVVYAAGQSEETAQTFENMDFPGVTKPEHIWKIGMYQIAQGILRPESYTIRTDVEHLACSRGDLVRLTHDVPLIGQGSARIRDVIKNNGDVTHVKIDEDWIMDNEDDHALRIRLENGTSIEKSVVANETEKNIIEFSEPITDEAEKPAGGELVMFGLEGSESGEFLVRQIIPKDELAAELVLVDYSPEIYEVDEPPIPDFHSNLTVPSEFRAPKIEEIRSDRDVLYVDEQLRFEQQIVAKLELRNVNYDAISHYDAEIKSVNGRTWRRQRLRPEQNIVEFSGNIQSGTTYKIRVRAVDALGFTSTWRMREHTATGDTNPPDDVQNFNLRINSGRAVLTWDPVENEDLAYYQIRFSHETGEDIGWNNGITLNDRIGPDATSFEVDAIQGTYMIRAIDFGGRKSTNEAIVSTTFGGIETLLALEEIEEHPEWKGIKENTVEIAGDLTLGGSDTIGDWPELAQVATIAMGMGGIVDEGIYYFDDRFELSAPGQIRIGKDLQVFGEVLSNQIRFWESLAEIDRVGAAYESEWDIDIEFRSSLEVVPTETDFSEWQPLTINEIEAAVIEFRAVLSSYKDTVRPRINQLAVELDVSERVEADSNITVPTTGATVEFSSQFLILSGLGVTLNTGQAGDNWEITNKDTSGFEIQIYDSNGTSVERIIDYLAKGGGAVVEV